ncbi:MULTISPECIES: hypothetical protein [unclassified Halomonas]|uniref:hypothetical protein n=1 Tax=unclassified Halomonas TaxID=2609666 RepID=UPI0007D96567|nr:MULTISPECIES: hypothetical protein [unclassified Halomonas]MBT2788030.1 hypothetical protein [Halomonas sp. ISL-106]MBT2795779.1 hypothetical protein [Halomonas sp. ISL-104]OAL61072.1 hypothetical protein A6R74_15835 [Halomonas sp. ALS9]
MITPSYTLKQNQELNELEAKYGFPDLIVASVDSDISATLTPLQRQHATNWRSIANQRFGEELKAQLGRQSTLEELANRLSLSIAINQFRNDCTTLPKSSS